MIIKQEGVEESELLSLPLKSQLLQRGVVQLCRLGRDYLPHSIRYGQSCLPAAVQSPAWVLAWVRSCVALLLLWGRAALGAGLMS